MEPVQSHEKGAGGEGGTEGLTQLRFYGQLEPTAKALAKVRQPDRLY